MSETHPLFDEIARLSKVEQNIIDRFIHRQRVARDLTQARASLILLNLVLSSVAALQAPSGSS